MGNMVSFEDISFGYADGSGRCNPVFHKLNLNIKKGEYLAVAGPNGSGKTTLLMLAKGILAPASGRILYMGEDIAGKGINWKIGYLFSNPEDQFVSWIVEEDVAFGPENEGLGAKDIRMSVDRGMELTGITHLKRRLTHLLSGGEQQKVLISGILAMNVDCIMFDEAASMLDPAARREVTALLRSLNAEGGITVIHVTHGMEDILAADRVVALKEGEVVFEGPPLDFIEDDGLNGLAGFEPNGTLRLILGLKKEGMIREGGFRDIESIADEISGIKKRPAK